MRREREAGIRIEPREEFYFEPLKRCAYKDVKVVFLAGTPVPLEGVNDGLCLSVFPHVSSLPYRSTHLLACYQRDVDCGPPFHGHLGRWASEGVLLWNAVPTCVVGDERAHNHIGWGRLTFEILSRLNAYRKNIVFVLIGKRGNRFAPLFDREKHLVIEVAHPYEIQPVRRRLKFDKARVFSTTNAYLKSKGIAPINWRLGGS